MFPTVIETIKNTAKNIVAPSVHPVSNPSLYIPIPVETNEATSKIYNIVSPKHSNIIENIEDSSFSTGKFSPYSFLSLIMFSFESMPFCYEFKIIYINIRLKCLQ